MLEQIALNPKQKAIVVSVVSPTLPTHQTIEQTQKNIDELKELLRTLDIQVVEQFIQQKNTLESSTLLGKGKWESIQKESEHLETNLVVFDGELTASQVKNIHELTKLQVVDRSYVILEIFSQNAKTKIAKLQMNISRLEYLMPRLTSLWGHFTKQKGGIGLRSGEGEQQLELDRRIVRKKIEMYKDQLEKAKTAMAQKKKKRNRYVSTAALVGYTNAGKSSLMNALTKSEVLVENKLFATLDSTCKALNPNSHPPMVLMDTVGFISQLPANLFEGFKTTLESAMDAQLLLIVCDVSSKDVTQHLEVTLKTLEDLNVEKKRRLFIFNKRDLLKDQIDYQAWKLLRHQYRPNVLVSAQDELDMKALRDQILEIFLKEQARYDLFIPFYEAMAISTVKSSTNIIKEHTHEKGMFFRIRVPKEHFSQLGLQNFLL